MKLRNLISWLAIAAQACAPLGLAGQDQNGPAAAQQPFTFHVNSDLVLVNVVVRDKQGRPVRGLKREDFTLLEEGKAQKIASFDVEEVETAGTLQAATPPPAAPPSAASPADKKLPPINTAVDSRNKRLVVLFFDFSGMEIEDIQHSAESAQKYIDKQMTPADLVAIVSFNTQLKVDQDFTADKAALSKTISRYTGSSGNAGLDAGSTGDTEGTAENGAGFTADDTDFNSYNTDRKLQALQSLADALGSIQQKKSIVYFSGSVQRGLDNQAQLRATINSAVKANVAIYAVDSEGLQAFPPGGNAGSASARGVSAFSGAGMRNAYDSNFSGSETLVTLAKDTGGEAFLDTNDFSGVFDKVQEDTASYYVIGYRSNAPAKDGKYRRIAVKTSVKDVKLEYRNGYYAGKDFAHFNKEDRDEQMQNELSAELPDTDVALYLAASYFRLSDDRFFVPVSLIVPGSQIPFVKASDQDKATLDVIGQVREQQSRFPIANVRETVKLAVDQNQNVARKNVQYNTGFILAPGKYELKFVVRENQNGALGSFETTILVPDLRKQPGKTALKMSSVVLASQMKPAAKAQKENPLVRNGQELVPNITHVFTPDQHMLMYYEVYDPAKAQPAAVATPADAKTAAAKAKNPVHVLSSVQFFSDDIKAFETPLLEVDELSNDRKAAVFQLDVPLQKLHAGYYICQVNVVDDAGEKFSFPRFPVLLKPATPVKAP